MAGCGDDGAEETDPGDDPGVGDETETTADESPGAGGNDTPEETEESTEPGEDTETEEETEPGEDTETETPGGESDATVQAFSHSEYGEILVDSEGMVVYMFEEDDQGSGESACTDDCTGNWPPVTVEDDEPSVSDEVTARLSTFEREDGTRQVTVNGWPVYYFADDEEPGDANGQGANDVWWVLDTEGNAVMSGASGTETETPTEGGTETETPTGTGTSTGTDTPTPTDSP